MGWIMSKNNFTNENNSFLKNTNFENENIVKLQGIKPKFFYENLKNFNFIELNINNEAVAPFFNKLSYFLDNFENTDTQKIYLGLYFIELDSSQNGEISKAPLILMPINVLNEENTYKLQMDISTKPQVNPFVLEKLKLHENVKTPDFNEFESIDEYINSIAKICELHDYLLKNLSILGVCSISNCDEQNNVKTQNSTQQINFNELTTYEITTNETNNGEDFNNSSNNFLQENNKLFSSTPNDNIISDNSNNKENEIPFIKIMDLITSTKNKKYNKFSSKQIDNEISEFSIHGLTKKERKILHSVKNDISSKISYSSKSNPLPLVSNIAFGSLVQNKKVLYLSDSKSQIDKFHTQIKNDGYDNFTLVVNEDIIENDISIVYDNPKKETTFSNSELEALINSKKALKLELNTYLKTTHRVFEHMNITLFDLVQKILSLKEVVQIQDVYDLNIPNITEFTPLDLHRYIFHLNNYVKYYDASKIEIENTFWKNVDFSLTDKSDLLKIENTLNNLIDILKNINSEDNILVSSDSGYKHADVKDFYNLYTNLNDDIFSTNFIYNIDHQLILASLNKLKELQTTFSELKEEIYSVFYDDVFSSDILKTTSNLNETLKSILDIIGDKKYTSADELVNNLNAIHIETTSLLDILSKIFTTADELSDYFNISNCESIDEVKLLLEMFSFVLDDVNLSEAWFIEDERTLFITNSMDATKLQTKIENTKNKILTNYSENIFTVDFTSLNNQLSQAKDTEFDPVAIKIYKYLKTYKIDDACDLDFSETKEIIADLTDYANFKNNLDDIVNQMIVFYKKDLDNESDFSIPIKNLKIFEETLTAFNNSIPDKIKNFLVDSSSDLKTYELFTNLNKLITTDINNSKLLDDMSIINRVDLINSLNTVLTSSDEARYLSEKIETYAKKSGNINISEVTTATNKIAKLIEIQESFENLFQITSKKLPDLFNSYGDDFDLIYADIEIFKKLKNLLNKFEISEVDFYDFTKTIRQEILSNTQHYTYMIDEAIELFKIIFDFADNREDICEDFQKDLDFVNRLNSSFNLAKKSYRFSKSKEECDKLELNDFISNVIDNNLSQEELINTFLLSFYTKWLKETLISVNIKGDADYLDIHNKINEYFKITKDIYLYNKSSLYAKISKSIPPLTTNKSSFDEINVLLNELKPSKERKISNIFEKIPNLIFEVKPLLITTFDDFYKLNNQEEIFFDLVIVDNAKNVDFNLPTLEKIYTKQTILLSDSDKNHIENNIFDSVETNLIEFYILALQTRFNYALSQFLNTNYFDNKMFVPYTKNFDLDFKDFYIDSTMNNNVNKGELDKIIEILQDYYLTNNTAKNITQIVTLTDEQSTQLNALIFEDEFLSKLLEENLIKISTIKNYLINEAELTIFSLCVNEIGSFDNFINDSVTSEIFIKILLNTINSLYVVESINLISATYNEQWSIPTKLLSKLVQQYMEDDELLTIEQQNNEDLFTADLLNYYNDEYDISSIYKNQYNNIFVKKDAQIRLLLQSDLFFNNKSDYDEIYLKHHFAENIDNVQILNIFSFSWYLSNNYKTFIQNEIQNTLECDDFEENLLLLKETKTNNDNYNFFNLIPYEVADLYEIEPVNDVTVFVANAITHIVRIESPIHMDFIYKKLKSILGTSNSNFNLNDIINSALETYLKDIITVKDDFFWNTLNMEVRPRIPKDISNTRYITHIAVEELSEILLKIIEKSYGITLDSLVDACCKELGFSMQSYTIRNTIISVYENLLEKHKIINKHDKLRII